LFIDQMKFETEFNMLIFICVMEWLT
jgi:hypothetical protein